MKAFLENEQCVSSPDINKLALRADFQLHGSRGPIVCEFCLSLLTIGALSSLLRAIWRLQSPLCSPAMMALCGD